MVKNLVFFLALSVFCRASLVAQIPTDTLKTALADSTAQVAAQQDASFSKKNKIAPLSAVPDSTMKKVRRGMFSKNYPQPRTAALLSMVLPGAGQAYNKKWWKVPLAWGALGGIGYFTFDTQNTYRELRSAYKTKVNGGEPPEPYKDVEAATLRNYRDTFRGYTEKWYLALGVTYLLIVTDAFVDAHLAKFDVNDDLSFRLKPALEAAPGAPAFGLGISLSLSPTHPLTIPKP